MNNIKSLVIVVLVALLVGGFAGFLLRGGGGEGGLLGAITVPSVSTTTHGTALQSSLLYQWQFNVIKSIAALADSVSTSTSWNPASVTSTAPAILDVTMPSGYTIGDPLFVSINTSTLGLALGVVPSGTIASVILSMPDSNMDDTDIATATVKVWSVSTGAFLDPSNIYLTTTTTPYNN